MQQPDETNMLRAALDIALQAHAEQVRKGTSIPYISHPMAVASLVMEHGGDQEQAAAALLHDAIEDGGPAFAVLIKETLGVRVHDIVQGCTDGIPNEQGIKPPWEERKEKYLRHLDTASSDVLLVSCCDKLHNARAIVSDQHRIGNSIFERFKPSKEQTLWYYNALSKVFLRHKTRPSKALKMTVEEMHTLAAIT